MMNDGFKEKNSSYSAQTILYLGTFRFPDGDARGRRVFGIGKTLKELGHEVVFIGVDPNLPCDVKIGDTQKTFENFAYYNVGSFRSVKQLFSSFLVLKNVKTFLKESGLIDRVDIVVHYGAFSLSFLNLLLFRFFSARGIQNIVDCADWYSIKCNSVVNILRRIDNDFHKSYVNLQADGLIVISKFLQDYYESRGKKTVLIPPTTPESETPISSAFVRKSEKQDIEIIYAGVPFVFHDKKICPEYFKDRLDLMIEFLYRQPKRNFVFNIYGITQDQYLTKMFSHKDILQELKNNVVFHGRKDSNAIQKAVARADFSFLIRSNNRTTTAGFSTKFVESISCGTPVITTNTSDIAEYLLEGRNGFFLDFDPVVATNQLEKILTLPREKVEEMKAYCRKNNPFYYGHFTERLGNFLESCMK